MIIFDNGPAKGEHLMVRRAPKFLRVTICGLEVDALDQVDDTPEPHEQVHAYRRIGRSGGCFIDGRATRGFFAVARYEYIAEQPGDAELRDTAAWHAWCESQVEPQNAQRAPR